MRSASTPLPPSVSRADLSARLWLALVAGLGCAVGASAGLYPRFDQGELRLVLMVITAPFAAGVVAAGLGAPTAARAVLRTLLCAALLGVAATILPAAILTRSQHIDFGVACFFGAVCGSITGIMYGLPLALLCALGHRHVRAGTHEATDRAAVAGGVWLLSVAPIGLAGTWLLDGPKMDYALGRMVDPPGFPSAIACGAALCAVLLIVRGAVRLRTRASWIARVRSGLEPSFRLRPLEGRDRADTLPRLGEGLTVVEWLPEQVDDTTARTAYRVTATGRAIAIVGDERAIVI